MAVRRCLGCRKLITAGSYCPGCRQRRRASSGWAWGQIRRSILQRDGWRCTRCGARWPLEVHHRLRLDEGGTNAPDNLVTLCKSCHGQAELPFPPAA
jgi:5-methylcytosine-specific restriction endonuclease McrA